MSIQCLKTRGYVGLFGPGIDSMANQAIATESSKGILRMTPKLPYHITLLTKDELQGLGNREVRSIATQFQGTS